MRELLTRGEQEFFDTLEQMDISPKLRDAIHRTVADITAGRAESRDIKRDTGSIALIEDEGSWLLEVVEAGDDD